MNRSSAHAGLVNRRQLLQATGTLTLAVCLPSHGAPQASQSAKPTAFVPNAFVRIDSESNVWVVCKHLEMGQGSHTGLATLVAEELDADWAQVRVVGAPADNKLYANLRYGAQLTGGSTAMANSYDQLRKAGASARAMLVAAAAQRWSVPSSEIEVVQGRVKHRLTARTASFGELSAAAATQAVPESVQLKDPSAFRLIGKKVARKDSADKVRGRTLFTQDFKLPGMLTAVVLHPPRFGATVASLDATRAKAVAGVVDVVQIPSGVAVLARSFWAAKQGRDALSVDWNESKSFNASSDAILIQFKARLKEAGKPARTQGQADAAIAEGGVVVDAEYEFPYLAHAAMEPMNCAVRLSEGRCELWYGAQFQAVDQAVAASVAGLKPEQVEINMLNAGGSFGRRASPNSDYIAEAVHIAKAIGGKAPVKLVWTREDDMRAGFYRPLYAHRISAALDGSGRVVGWRHRIVGQSIMTGTAFEKALVRDGIDGTSVEGAASLPYAIPNLSVELTSPSLAVPVLWWRSVGSTHNAFSTETMLDELAVRAGKDPVEYRMAMLSDKPRHAETLKLAATLAKWREPLAPKPGVKRGRGVAVHESFGTVVAQIAEVSVKPDSTFRVDRVFVAVECGTAINPDVIKAQMEGGVGFGLSAALHSAITLKDGRVEQSNFHDYRVLRMNEMPVVEVAIVPSQSPPSGVGEPAVPVIAPAVANALFNAVGARLRSMPLRLA